MHSISWRQRNRNLERFFYKRTRKSYFSFSNSIHSQDVSVSPRTSDPKLHEASDGGANSQRKGGEVAIQQAELRSGKEDEAKGLLLSANGTVHG